MHQTSPRPRWTSLGLCIVALLARQAVLLAYSTEEAPLFDMQSSSPAINGRLPYVASIERPGTRDHVCSGVLISPRHVVTAAHCVDPESQYSAGQRPVVKLGAMDVDDPHDDVAEVMMVEHSTIHNRWKPHKRQASQFNIALLRLPQKSKQLPPRVLSDEFHLVTGQKLIAAGYGDEPALGGEIFSHMRAEPQEFIDRERCNRATLWNGSIEENTICALNDDRKASCVVDSGAPLLLLDAPGYNMKMGSPTFDFLVGLNIDGAPCGEVGKPDVYLDMKLHGEWINQVSQERHDEL